MLQPLSLIFKLNNDLVARALEGLSDDEVWQVPPGGGNPIGWILGHITETRVGLLRALGQEAHTGWGRKFSRGSTCSDRGSYPTPAEMQARWQGTRPQMRDAFAAATDAQLAQPNTVELPGVSNLGDQVAFFAFHESYHVGQIAYVRKQIGRSAIAG